MFTPQRICCSLLLSLGAIGFASAYYPPTEPIEKKETEKEPTKAKTQTASVRLYMPVQPTVVLFEHPEATSNFETYQNTQIALIRSRLIINKALSKPDIAKLKVVHDHANLVAWIEKELRIDHPDSPELIRLSMTGEDGRELGMVIKAVAEAYLSESMESALNTRRLRLKELEVTRKIFTEKLKALNDHQRKAKEALMLPKESPFRKELIARGYGYSFNRLVQARLALTDLEFRKSQFMNGQDQVLEISKKAIEEEYAKDLFIQELEKDHRTLELARIRSLRENNGGAKDLELQMKQNIDELKKRREEVRERAQELVIERTITERTAEQKLLPLKIRQARQDVEYWTADVENWEKQKKVVQQAFFDDSEIVAEIERAKKILERINEVYTKLEVEQGDPIRVKFFDDGRVRITDN